MNDLMKWLEQGDHPLSYFVLGVAAALEYVFPPFPGDLISLFGAFLAAAGGYSIPLVYGVLNIGSLAGAMVAYGVGRSVARSPERRPWLLRSLVAQRMLGFIEQKFETYGAIYLVLNRFIPGLRGFFFVGAGIARISVARVLFYGGISAMVWNALLIGAGVLVGDNWERLLKWTQRYSAGALIVVLAMALIYAALYWKRRNKQN